jgi:hypothetical protein
MSSDATHYQAFCIFKPVGNNAFSYAQRKNKQIYVPSLVKGTVDDLQVGEEIAFSEIQAGAEKNCRGLRQFVHLAVGKKDVFIFDNHNHAFFFWAYALKSGRLPPGLPLLHVDQHRDTREPPAPCPFRSIKDIDLSAAFEYTNFTLNVGNFIQPALQAGIFCRLEIIDSRPAFAKSWPGEFVLDLDMDIFSEDMKYIDETYKIEKIKELIQAARLITIATSPFFMDQPRAIRLIKTLLS